MLAWGSYSTNVNTNATSRHAARWDDVMVCVMFAYFLIRETGRPYVKSNSSSYFQTACLKPSISSLNKTSLFLLNISLRTIYVGNQKAVSWNSWCLSPISAYLGKCHGWQGTAYCPILGSSSSRCQSFRIFLQSSLWHIDQISSWKAWSQRAKHEAYHIVKLYGRTFSLQWGSAMAEPRQLSTFIFCFSLAQLLGFIFRAQKGCIPIAYQNKDTRWRFLKSMTSMSDLWLTSAFDLGCSRSHSDVHQLSVLWPPAVATCEAKLRSELVYI